MELPGDSQYLIGLPERFNSSRSLIGRSGKRMPFPSIHTPGAPCWMGADHASSFDIDRI